MTVSEGVLCVIAAFAAGDHLLNEMISCFCVLRVAPLYSLVRVKGTCFLPQTGTLVPRYDAQIGKVWVRVKFCGSLSFWFGAEARTLQALVTLVVWFGHWG